MAGLLPLNIKPLNPVSDLNEVHLMAGQGLTLLYTVKATTNKPEETSGIYFHVQRLEGANVVSTSQYIYQFTFFMNNIYYRFGAGNGTTISWTEWTSIPT